MTPTTIKRVLIITLALAWGLFLPKPTFAAITFDAVSSASGVGSSLTFAHTVGAGENRALIVGVALRKNGPTILSVTYGGVSLTRVGTQLDGGADHRAEIWKLVAPASGTANIVVTLSANVDGTAGGISYSGVDQTTPLGTAVGATGTSVTPSVTVSSASDEVVIDVLSTNGDVGTVTVGANQTQQWTKNTGTGDGDEFGAQSTETGASSVTMSWTLTNSNKWAILAVAVKPAPDTTAPAAISDLATFNPSINSIDISWTAPGDDGSTGTATSYDLRYSTSPITNDNFSSATAVSGEPSPSIAGSSESVTVSGLSASTLYYFALKTSDEVPNVSSISNVPNGTTTAIPDTIAPSTVSDLATSNASVNSIDLSWTSPGDDGNAGTAASYDIRYSTSPITSDNFSSATAVSGEPSPSIAGSNESMTVSGLSANTTYYFALKASDGIPNTSVISNLPSGTTSAGTPNNSTSQGSSAIPRTVTFSGQAYPMSTIEILRKSTRDEIYVQSPTETEEILPDGSFTISHSGFIESDYLFTLTVQDKDGRSTGALAFNISVLGDLFEVKDILVPPTIGFNNSLVVKNDMLKITGYAAPNSAVELELNNLKHQETKADLSGLWNFDVDTRYLSYGDHQVRVRQIATSGQVSSFSLTRVFKVVQFSVSKADLNSDGLVNITDWSIFLFRWGNQDETIRLQSDMNDDGQINIFDFSIFLNAIKL